MANDIRKRLELIAEELVISINGETDPMIARLILKGTSQNSRDALKLFSRHGFNIPKLQQLASLADREPSQNGNNHTHSKKKPKKIFRHGKGKDRRMPNRMRRQ